MLSQDVKSSAGFLPSTLKMSSRELAKAIRYHSKPKTAYLSVESNGKEVEKGPYRLVVFSSLAGKASFPKIPMQGFQGKLIHSSQFKAPRLFYGLLHDVLLQVSPFSFSTLLKDFSSNHVKHGPLAEMRFLRSLLARRTKSWRKSSRTT